jgi:transcriptional regulator with XRE-family HTH domain
MCMTFGERMRELMAERGVSLRSLAKHVPCDIGYLSKISNDHKPPSKRLADLIDQALGADGTLAALRSTTQRARTGTVVGSVSVHATEDEDDMQRRTLLQLAALGMGAGALAATGEPVRQLLALSLGSEPRSIEDWHLACSDHLHALRTRPPVQVRDALSVVLLALDRQLYTATPGETTELNRVVAMLGVLYANALTRLGEHGGAIHWWRTSKVASAASGDVDLHLAVRGEEAGFGLYGQRDPATVLTLLDQQDQVAGGSRQFWRADRAGTRAKALALLGRHQEAISALHAFVDGVNTQPPPNPFPALWKPDMVIFAQSWVYAHAGDEARADEARNQMLSLASTDVYEVNVQLHEALCTVRKGGIDRGMKLAATVLDPLPAANRNMLVAETARMVLDAVPIDQRHRPAVQDLKALTSGPAALT